MRSEQFRHSTPLWGRQHDEIQAWNIGEVLAIKGEKTDTVLNGLTRQPTLFNVHPDAGVDQEAHASRNSFAVAPIRLSRNQFLPASAGSVR